MAFRRARVSAASDAGFTAIEMVVALIIIMGVAAASTAVVIQTLRSGRAHELRVDANQLAQAQLENVMAEPWSAIGFWSTDSGYVSASPAGESTVTLTTSPRPASAPYPSSQAVKGGVTFTINTYITWVDDPTDGLGAADLNGNTQDDKHVEVVVSWTDNYGHARSITLDDLRTPTATEAPPVSGSGFIVTASGPATATLDASGNPSPSFTITATTSKTATSASVTFTNRTGAHTVAMTNTSGGTSWSATIASTTGTFDTGNTTFSVAAKTSSLNANGSAVVRLVGSGSGTATVDVTAAPDQTLTSTGTLSSAISITVTGSATISSGTVTFATDANPTVSRPLSGSGSAWSYTIPADSIVYDPGTEIFTVNVTFADGTSRTATDSITLVSPAVPPDVTALIVTDPYGGNTPFCVSGSYQLYTATNVDATVSNVASTDQVYLTAPQLTTQNFTMSYLKTNADGSMVFRFTAPSGTQFPAASSIQLKAFAIKTISGVQYRDDYIATPNFTIATAQNKTKCT